MTTALKQLDLKLFFATVPKHGTQKRIATRLGVTKGDISRRFNPNDEERKLLLAGLLIEAQALCEVDPEAGESLLNYIISQFETWLSKSRHPSDLSLLASNIDRETSEFICARLRNKPAAIQLKEALDIVAAAKQVVQGLQAEISRKGSQIAAARQHGEILPLRRRSAR